jgi:hypothetical protein
LDILSIDENSLVVDDIDDGGKFALKGSVVNSSNAADFNEFGVSLSY